MVQPSQTGITEGSEHRPRVRLGLKRCRGHNRFTICLKSNTTQQINITAKQNETGPRLETNAVLLNKPAALTHTACLFIPHWFIRGSHKGLQMRERPCVQRARRFPSPGRTDLMIKSLPVSSLSPCVQQTQKVCFSVSHVSTLLSS